jgi:DNA modification methylase
MSVRNRKKEIRSVRGSELVPNPSNWRRHPAPQRAAMEGILAEVGDVDYLKVVEQPDGRLMLLDGHLRADIRGDEVVDVVVLDLDDVEQRLVLATFDPVAAMAETDAATQAELLASITVDDAGVADLLEALRTQEMAPFTIEQPVPVEDEEAVGAAVDEAEAPEYVPFTSRGQVWRLGDHRLMCGDATFQVDVVALMDGQTPTLMVTDPPYGVNYEPNWRNEAAAKGQLAFAPSRVGKVTDDTRTDWSDAWRLFSGDVAYCWSAPAGDSIVSGLALQSAGFQIRASVIWRKPHFPISRGHYTFQHEPCWYGVRKGETAAWIGPANATTVWDIALDKNASPDAPDGGHSTQKPVECMERPMSYHTGDVYDPFVGSGTTIIAAEKLGRRCYAMEIEPRYCDVAIRRWEAFTGRKAELVEGPRA